MLQIPGYHGQDANLLLFLVLVDQASDVLQYIWGKALGRRPIAPLVSPNKTWEGFVGGVGSATLIGTALWWATPFNPWEADCVVTHDYADGIRGRPDNVRDQARQRSQRLGRSDPRPRGNHGSNRLALLRRADLFPPDQIFLQLDKPAVPSFDAEIPESREELIQTLESVNATASRFTGT
jgi:hypothetical protein